MKLSDFGYFLPQELIAQRPLLKREAARLLVVDRQREKISHDVFSHIGRYLPFKSLIILNDSKVIPARLLGRRARTGGEVEIFLLKKLDDNRYQALLRPLKRLKDKERIVFPENHLVACLEDREKCIVSFNTKNVTAHLSKIGHIPLPPYIKRRDEPVDRKFYQTVYAQKPGSVAAPTAGLHFTKRLLKKLRKDGHVVGSVTLHVNYATFKPVGEEDISKHKMYEEDYQIPATTIAKIKKAQSEGRKIVAVGTTSCRVLETWANTGEAGGTTHLFIYPGYTFKMTDILVTNFHQPFTTLLMLVYAFGGMELMKRAYQEAIDRKYRLFSYGDAMVVK